MIRTVEATIDAGGAVHLLEPLSVKRTHRVLVTVLEESVAGQNPEQHSHELALLSEQSLARDWNRKEEDEAWSHLQ